MSKQAELNIAEISYESGGIKFRYTRFLSVDSTRWIRHGLFMAYHENGNLAYEGHYLNGQEDGLWRDFHPNGQIASEGRYSRGQEVGIWSHWSPERTAEPHMNYGE